MNPTIERLKLIFLGIFAVANVGILVWQLGWAWPEEKCTQARKWWDGSQRVCAQPSVSAVRRKACGSQVRVSWLFFAPWGGDS